MTKKIPLGLKLLLPAVIGISFILWMTVPDYRYGKLMEEVVADLARRDFVEAEAKLSKAIKLNPKSREAVVMLSNVLRPEAPEASFSLLYSAFQRGLLISEDLPGLAILGFEVQEIEKAEEVYVHADSTFALVPRLATVRGLKSLVEGDLQRCLQLFEESIALDSSWATTYYWKGQLLKNSASRIDQLQAKQAFSLAAEKDDFDGLRACLALAYSTNMAVTDEEKINYLKTAQAHQWASDKWQLLALNVLTQLDSDNRQVYIEEAIREFGTKRPELLGGWLNRVGEFKRALDYIPESESDLTDPDLFNERFVALSLAGKTDEAESLLKTTDTSQNPLQQASRFFLLSLNQNDGSKTVERWEEAFKIAEEIRNEQALVFLSKNALRIRYLEGARKGYDSLFQDGFETRATAEIWSERFSTEILSGNTDKALKIAREALTFFPRNIILMNNMLYLELLLDEFSSETVDLFASILPPLSELNDPERFGSTLSFARLKQGRVDEAKRIIDQIVGLKGQAGVAPSTEIIAALIYKEKGDLETAIQIANSIAKDSVLDQEWLLISHLRAD